MDPAALVQMALNLSQSRRLNLAPGQLASMPGTVGGRRVVSASFMPAGAGAQAGYARLAGNTMQRTSGQYASEGLQEAAMLSSRFLSSLLIFTRNHRRYLLSHLALVQHRNQV